MFPADSNPCQTGGVVADEFGDLRIEQDFHVVGLIQQVDEDGLGAS